MATPKNPLIMLRIIRGTRIKGAEDGEMVSIQPDGFGGPIVELKAPEAADLIAGRRAVQILGDAAKDAALSAWRARVEAGEAAAAKKKA